MKFNEIAYFQFNEKTVRGKADRPPPLNHPNSTTSRPLLAPQPIIWSIISPPFLSLPNSSPGVNIELEKYPTLQGLKPSSFISNSREQLPFWRRGGGYSLHFLILIYKLIFTMEWTFNENYQNCLIMREIK